MKSSEFSLFDCPLSGVTLVEAGAGTGKTYNIASLYLRLLFEKKLKPSEILVLTYTDAAASELKSRIRNRIKDCIMVLEGDLDSKEEPFLSEVYRRYSKGNLPELYRALYQFDEAPVATMHGFCQRLLKEDPLAFGVSPDFDILTDETVVLQEVIDRFWRDFFQRTDDAYLLSVQKFILDEIGDPDKLRSLLREPLSKPYAHILPETGDLNAFREPYERLLKATSTARDKVRYHKNEYMEVLDSGKLFSNVYNVHKFTYLDAFIESLESEPVSLKSHEKAYLFSGSLYTKIKKAYKNEGIHIEATKAVDQYLDALDAFQGLRSSFIQTALKEVASAYEDYKNRRNLLTYDDLLRKVDEGLTEDLVLAMRKASPIALLDEFQDTDPVQYNIFSRVYAEKGNTDTALFMIGDPKQAIYKFRGADIHTYLNARNDADKVYTLSYNYRSTPELIEAVNTLFVHTENPFLLEGLEFEKAKYPEGKELKNVFRRDGELCPALNILNLEAEAEKVAQARKEVAESVSAEIVALLSEPYKLDNNDLEEQDIAVLVRTNKQGKLVQAALQSKGISSVIRSKDSVFKSKESDELYLILKAVRERRRDDLIRAALSTDILGYTAADLIRVSADTDEWNVIREQFDQLFDSWNKMGIRRFRMELNELFKPEYNLAVYPNAERRITNLDHLFELLATFENEKHTIPDTLLRVFNSRRNDENVASEDETIRLESDDKLIQIVTVHSSKGLQYPVIFVPYMWDENFTKEKPYVVHSDGRTIIDMGTSESVQKKHESLLELEDMAERIRLAYVALTRAESACYLYLCEQKEASYSSLALLAEGFESVMERKNSKKKKKGDFDLLNEYQQLIMNSEALIIRDAKRTSGIYPDFTSTYDLEYWSHSESNIQTGTSRKINSYSSLTSRSYDRGEEKKDGRDYDQLETGKVTKSGIRDAFSLPAGAATGTMLHQILERISFKEPDNLNEIVREEVRKGGLNKEWEPVVEQLIINTITHELSDGVSLSNLRKNDYVPEIEFYIPQKSVRFSDILYAIRSERTGETESLSGYLKGFIDLTFRIGDIYYIADYKSNILGDGFQDYGKEQINRAMHHSFYDVQYHLYTLALHRYLKRTVANYEYETHFGGAYYIFMRGIQNGIQGSGIFFNKPDESVIRTLDRMFSED